MHVHVFGQRELVEQLQAGHQPTSHLISIGNPGKGIRGTAEDSTVPRIFKDSYKSILRLEFYDAEYKHHLKNQWPRRIPQKKDVRKLIRFIQKTRNEATGYTVHCWQGVSRSTAVALCVHYMFLDDENKAVESLMKNRPEAVPHRRILQYFDQMMGCRLKQAAEPVIETYLAGVKSRFFSEIENGDALLTELEAVEDFE